MIKHIVMWKLKETPHSETKENNLREIKQKLESLPHQIHEIITFEVDINMISSPAHFDISLISTFESIEALNTYIAHPAHVEVANRIKQLIETRTVIDAHI